MSFTLLNIMIHTKLSIKNYFSSLMGLLFISTMTSQAQISDDLKGFFTSLEEARKNPSAVYRLDLSDQDLRHINEDWSKFSNLEYLNLANDHLQVLPEGIGYLKNLKVLDLSGNAFKTLPSTFKKLQNLEEIFLNNEKDFRLNKSISILGDLPRLKVLHLEGDDLNRLPKRFSQLHQIEQLYLNDNKFIEIPRQIKRLKNLKFVDLHNNDMFKQDPSLLNQNFGFKIVF